MIRNFFPSSLFQNLTIETRKQKNDNTYQNLVSRKWGNANSP